MACVDMTCVFLHSAAALLWDAIPPSWNAEIDRPVLPVPPLELELPSARDPPPHLAGPE